MSQIDHYVIACLFPLAVWILISGLDDLFLDVVWLWMWMRRRFFGAAPPAGAVPDEAPEKRIAVLVPLWREHAVIGRMLEHNLAAIRYRNYEFFVGAYPNDGPTLDAVREAEARFANVHLAVCPHDGPTSKADCLNWICRRLFAFEEQRGGRFEMVVVHDAEDLIHPEELRWISHYGGEYGMVQIPVLPLQTRWRRFTHGVYCDEFAEFQSKDLPVRQWLGGFIPSNGVGTGYTRAALEALAAENGGRIFDPGCLTEDYDSGLRLRRLGYRQLFVPISFVAGRPVATREFFPRQFRHALAQRTRWVLGIALQSWQRHGWRAAAGRRQVYWLWRDRKGLLGNPVTILANAILAYGIATWIWSRHTGAHWGMAQATQQAPGLVLLWTTCLFQAVRTGVRAGCAARIYGWKFAAGVPLRVFWGNWINFLATVSALAQYSLSSMRRLPLAWAKTEHTYPSLAALMHHKRPLGEILLRAKFIQDAELRGALESKPAGVTLGQHLLALGRLSEEQLYHALSLQQSVPLVKLDPAEVPRRIARALPAWVVRSARVLPFRISRGRIYLAGPELPGEEMQRELGRFTRLELQFRFITPSDFRRLSDALLGGTGSFTAPGAAARRMPPGRAR